MNNFLKQLPLPAKFFIIAIIPIAFISYLTIKFYNEKSKNVAHIQLYLNQVKLSANISQLIDQLQFERHYSFNYVLVNTSGNQMLSQRPATDAALAKITGSNDETIADFAEYTFLKNIDSIRQVIDNNNYTSGQVMHFYSSTIFRLNTLNRLPAIPDETLNDVYKDMRTQKILSELITYQGIINSNIYNVLVTKRYVAETLLGTLGTYDVYKTYLKELEIKAASSKPGLYNSMANHEAVRNVNDHLSGIFSTYKVDSTYSADEWKKLSDNSLNHLRNMQLSLLANVEKRINQYSQEELASRTIAIISLIVITLLIVFVLVYMLSFINQSLVQLNNAAVKIAAGETDIDVQDYSKDAVGSLALSIKTVDAKNKELASIAKSIGEGKFNINFQPRGQKDTLGTSLLKMKENLQRFTTDLQNSREEFKKLADFMPQIVWTSKPDGQTDYYNQKWYEVTGAKQGFDEHNWISVLHPDDVGRCLTTWYSCIESGEDYNIESRLRDVKTATYRWFLIRALPIKNEGGDITKWFGTATDIHDQKLQNEKLEELVASRTLELKRSNEDLQQFAHVASHDLKEPVRKLRTFTDRLSTEFGHALPDKGKIYIDKLISSSERMYKMIDSILSYSIVNSTEQGEELVDLNLVMEDIITDLELLILQSNSKITYANLPCIYAVPVLIHQLFYNLINNAIKFSKENQPPCIEIAGDILAASQLNGITDLRKAKSYVQLSVKDNGIGFDQQYAKKLFTVFTRLHSKDRFEGTGLGLALCKKIVHRHGGIIYAKSKLGEGSTFSIILPRKDLN